MIIKILGATNLSASDLEALGRVCKLTVFDANVPAGGDDYVVARAHGADVIGVNVFTPVTARVVDRLPELRAIVTCSAGTDHIDLGACHQAGVVVYSFPAYCARTLAEKTLAYILMGLNRIVPAIDNVRAGRWDYLGFQGREAPGRTVVVVGRGGVGGLVAELCEALSFTVETMNSTTPAVEKERLLATADVLTLHIPLNDRTRHFLNEETIALLKDDVVIVNTARGALIDDVALMSFLSRSPRTTALLDVLGTEPPASEGHLYRGLPNAIITPHTGWNSTEATQRLGAEMLGVLLNVATGKLPLRKDQ